MFPSEHSQQVETGEQLLFVHCWVVSCTPLIDIWSHDSRCKAESLIFYIPFSPYAMTEASDRPDGRLGVDPWEARDG